jgi:hypothetical protein
MLPPVESSRLATLWTLAWDQDLLRCVVYRTEGGMRLAIESDEAVVHSEGFELQPRALRRARALGDALRRRGWRDASAAAP